MKKLLAALIVLFSTPAYGCGSAPMCRTRCGMELEFLPGNEDPSWTCENLQLTEDQMLESFKLIRDPRFAETCQRVQNEGIYVVGARSWRNKQDKQIAGETFCSQGYVLVYNAEPWNIALPHEMAHVVQGCWPLGPYPTDGGAYDHANWDRDNIYSAIRDVKNKMTDAGIP